MQSLAIKSGDPLPVQWTPVLRLASLKLGFNLVAKSLRGHDIDCGPAAQFLSLYTWIDTVDGAFCYAEIPHHLGRFDVSIDPKTNKPRPGETKPLVRNLAVIAAWASHWKLEPFASEVPTINAEEIIANLGKNYPLFDWLKVVGGAQGLLDNRELGVNPEDGSSVGYSFLVDSLTVTALNIASIDGSVQLDKELRPASKPAKAGSKAKA